jgi:tellurite resistance protein TerC
MGVTAAGWALTIGVIVALLALDLALATVRSHAVGYREATAWSAFYIAVAVIFGLVFASQVGWGYGTEYFAGYLVEKSLSVDNLFVFVIIMSTFAVPPAQQPRALSVGIVIALVLRGIFIALGAALLEAFSVMFLVFGLALVVTAVQLFRHREHDPSLRDSAVIRLARRRLPISRPDGNRFITRRDGRRRFTPLALVLVALGTTDLLFALDSIPAVFGVTSHAYIVFCANAFALLGLRSSSSRACSTGWSISPWAWP